MRLITVHGSVGDWSIFRPIRVFREKTPGRKHGAFPFLAPAAALAICVLVGCGGSDGPERYPVEGAVIYDGKPVPAGRIDFEPDPAQGNKGPAGYATIEDGRYATAQGKGTVGGPLVVRITGTDGEATGESPYGTMLFPTYTTSVDLPHESTTHDFDLPATPR